MIVSQAILPLIGVLVGAGLQYLFAKALEQRRQATLLRMQAYVDYFKAFALVAQQGRSEDRLAMVADAKVRVCIYGSSSVIRELADFERAGALASSPNGVAIIVRLLRTMRRDSGSNNRGIADKDLERIALGHRT